MTTHDLTRTPPTLLRRARRMLIVVAVIVPLVITGIAAAVILAWLPSFSGDVAIHWGMDGADGFAPASTYLWILIVTGLVLPVLMAVVTLAAVGAHWGEAARLMGAVSAGLAAFAAALAIGSLAIQRDAPSPADVPGVGGVLALAVLALAALGAAAWAAQPRVRASHGPTLEARRAVQVADGERVVWLGEASMPRAAVAGLLVVLLGLVALAAVMVAQAVEVAWVVVLAAVVVAVAIAATTTFRVRVTPEGFRARSLLGWPRVSIPIAEIVSARAVEISPFAEFGGWGWRIAVDGRSGIVTRRGPAMEVARRGRAPFIVTIDGAAEGAALLQAYVDRAVAPDGEVAS